MSLYGAMYTGASGLSAQSRALGVISENIANVNTVGYKASRSQFSTLVTGNGSQADLTTNGVRARADSLIRHQGQLQGTGNATDLGISGDGFFIVSTQASGGQGIGESLFTRAGAFTVDADQNLVNGSGHYLMGWALDANGQFVNAAGNPFSPDRTSTADLRVLNLDGLSYGAEPTSTIGLRSNLPATARTGESYQTSTHLYDAVGSAHQVRFDWLKVDDFVLGGELDSAASPMTVTHQVSDSLGQSHDLSFTYAAAGANSWTLTASTPDGTVSNGSMNLTFDPATGQLTSPAETELTVSWGNGATDSTSRIDLSGLAELAGGTGPSAALRADTSTWKLDVSTGNPDDAILGGGSSYVSFNGDGTLQGPGTLDLAVDWDDNVTAAANADVTVSLGTPGKADGVTNFGQSYATGPLRQDGAAYGAFTGVAIDNEGTVNALFDNGRSRPVFKIPVARFANPDGLVERTGNAYQPSPASGGFFLNESGVGGAGEVTSNALEASTVDLAAEFTNMITTQRAYSANATIITTADEMLQELSQIKR